MNQPVSQLLPTSISTRWIVVVTSGVLLVVLFNLASHTQPLESATPSALSGQQLIQRFHPFANNLWARP